MIWWTLLGTGTIVIGYAFIGYPLALLNWSWLRRRQESPGSNAEARLPTVSLIVPVYNEAHQVEDTISNLLELRYPRERLQILFLSDGSDDGTDEIVEQYEASGIELLRIEGRQGKGAAENAAGQRVRGDVVVTMDASIRVLPDSLRFLVQPFSDPTVGVVSGRDVSVGAGSGSANQGEAGYVGYEMWVRELETRTGGIVGASGCFYASRRELHRLPVPPQFSRDFASVLVARNHGYRSVSAPGAVCFVPRTSSLRREYRRKVRTVARGLSTLRWMRHLLNPFRFGAFAWKLFSHKICRWLVPWAGLLILVGIAGLAPTHGWARWALLGAAGVMAAGAPGLLRRETEGLPRVLAVPAFFLMTNAALLHAWIQSWLRPPQAAWEPTRRIVG